MQDREAFEFFRNHRSFYKQRRNEFLFENGPCACCRSWLDLELDHIDPSVKETEAAHIFMRKDWRDNPEVKKLRVLCALCHRVRHAPPHGTRGRYVHMSCRCRACTSAATNYIRRRRAARKGLKDAT